ncbi:MAG: OsmC family protein [Deltaproteobacteria bacterium]|nr:OsmC family protein [Deltaproteobacteria bacterium]
MESKAKAIWKGSLKEGSGTISTSSNALKNVEYAFKTRFEGASGTNPEELIAASHAACFSMALSAELGKSGITPQSVETSAAVVLEKQGEGFGVTQSNLTATVNAPGADRGAIEKAAAGAKEGCPISKLLNARISLELSINT